MASFDVPKTVVEINPLAEVPPLTPLTCQVAAVLVDPVTVAVNGCVAEVAIVITLGEIVTLTWANEWAERPEISATRTATGATKARRPRFNFTELAKWIFIFFLQGPARNRAGLDTSFDYEYGYGLL
jgi:hypothetical protein